MRHDRGMFLAAIIVGGLAAWYFGLRAGAYAAICAVVLCLIARFVSVAAIPIYLVIGASVIGIQVVGSRRKQPQDVVRAVRFLRMGWKRVFPENKRSQKQRKQK